MEPANVFDVTDKVVVITGGCGGIGSALARGFTRYGANVMVADIIEPEEANGQLTYCPVDLADSESVRALGRFVVAELSRVDVLINTAAVVERGLAEELPMEEVERTLRVNLLGTFQCCQELGKVMIAQTSGKIINFGSRAGYIGSPFSLAYNASKAGIVSMTQTLAVEWGLHNIQVNALIPSLTRTPLASLDNADPVLVAILGGRSPLGRVGEPDDFLGPALFLSSSASDYVTGTALLVDGGNIASGGIGTEVRDYELRKRAGEPA